MGTPPVDVIQQAGTHAPLTLKIAPSGRVIRSSGRSIIPPATPANSDVYKFPKRSASWVRLLGIASVGIFCGALISLCASPIAIPLGAESPRYLFEAVQRNVLLAEGAHSLAIPESPRQAQVQHAVKRVSHQPERESAVVPAAPSVQPKSERLRLAQYSVEPASPAVGPALVSASKPTATLQSKAVAVPVRAIVGRVHSVIKKYAPKHSNPSHLAHAIVNESARQGVDPLFVAAVIKSESTFNSTARSNKGAQGLMQIMPATGAWLTAKHDLPRGKLSDPGHNLKLGISYLKQLEESYDGNRVFALVAYNWGPGHLEAAAGGKRKIPKECMQYALKIIQDYKRWSSGVI